MKKLILCMIILSLALSAGCVDINAPEDDSSKVESVSMAESKVESAPPTSKVEFSSSVESTTEETTSDHSSAEAIIDYDYAIELSEEELDCIHAGRDGEYLMLVNKENKLDDGFVPEDLVDIRDTRKDRAPEKMVKTAEVALHAFLKEAAYYGYGDVTITSGYRSIAKQQSLFNMYVNNEMAKGKDKEAAIAAASTYSAYPGTSEHHTGLCADMHNLPAASQAFGDTDAAKWMAENAHRFGFMLRFPQGKDDITGYMWEPWHFRFVGIDHATEIYLSGLTLEEYLEEWHNELA